MAVTGALLACEWAAWPFLRQPLQNVMTSAAGVPVLMEGDFRLHLLIRPSLAVGHLHVAAPSGVPVPHLLDAQQVRVAWRWLDVWRWQRGEGLRLRHLQAAALDTHLVRTADGRASWQLGSSSGTPGTASPVPRVGTLTLDRGHIVFNDSGLSTQLDIQVQGGEAEGAQKEKGPQGYQATATGRYRGLPLRLQARSGAVLPLLQEEEPGDTAPSLDVRVEGSVGAASLFFEGRASALWSARRIDGALRLRGPSLARIGEPLGVTLPRTPPFELTGWLSQGAGVWHLRADRMSIGRSLLAGDFRYDTGPSPAHLSGRLHGPRLVLADLGPAVGTPGAEGDVATARVSGRVLPQRRFDLPSLRAMNADVAVQIDELDFASTALGSFRQLRSRLLLEDGVLQLQNFQAAVAGGQVAGSMRLDGRADAAKWATDLRFGGVDVATWIRGLQTGSTPAKGGGTPMRAYVTGELNAEVQVTGAGRSTAEILSTLEGQVKMRLGQGTLSHLATEVIGLDVAQALGVVLSGDQPLPLRCARVELAVHRGVLETQRAVLDNRDSTVQVGGRVDLRNETLALRMTAQPKDLSLLSLRTPVTVGGTLSDPAFGIEGRRLAGRLLSSVVLGAVATPAAALLPLIDPGAGKKHGDPCVTPPQATSR